MPIEIRDLDNGVTHTILTGRLDVAGAEAIDLPMNVVGGSRKAVIVDLEGVEFIGSMGLRAIVMLAKTVQRRGGRAVLVAPRPEVAEVITTSGIDELIAIHADHATAIVAVLPG